MRNSCLVQLMASGSLLLAGGIIDPSRVFLQEPLLELVLCDRVVHGC